MESVNEINLSISEPQDVHKLDAEEFLLLLSEDELASISGGCPPFGPPPNPLDEEELKLIHLRSLKVANWF